MPSDRVRHPEKPGLAGFFLTEQTMNTVSFWLTRATFVQKLNVSTARSIAAVYREKALKS